MVLEGWSSETLGRTIKEFRGGGTPSRTNPAYWDGQIPWASVKDLNEVRLTRTSERITHEGLENSSASLVPPGTVILATRMAVGRVVTAGVHVAINQDLKGLFPGENLDPKYLRVWLEANENRLLALASGTTVKGIRLESLRAFPVLLPSLPEQRKIAAILSSVDEAIAATRRVIEQTERVKQGLLQTLMTCGIGHTRFKQTEIGEIPEAWKVVRLSDIADVNRGKFSARPRNDPRFYGGDIPFVQTADVAGARDLLVSHSQTLNESGLYVSRLFPTGTILITIAANIGSVAEATYPVAFPDSLVGIQPNPAVNGRWLLYALQTRHRYLNNVATQNAQKNINLQVLRPLLVALPPRKEQQEIAQSLDALREQLARSEAALELFVTLKRGLMQDLLTGRVRVQPD